jgi:Methyltransferase domain
MSTRLNLGCGSRYVAGWINVDSVCNNSEVIACDLTKPLPFHDGQFEVVYSSHLLEHLSQNDAERLIAECFRILRPDGIMRLVVPDFELLACRYIKALNEAKTFSKAELEYDWCVLELLDQLVRDHSGGEIARFLLDNPAADDIAIRRWGNLAREIIKLRNQPSVRRSFAFRAQRRLKPLTRFWWWRLRAACLILGSSSPALKIGMFRESGEVHKWMYDEFSLGRVLKTAGFTSIRKWDAHHSQISRWSEIELDVNKDGSVYKPDSLFMEGIKRV